MNFGNIQGWVYGTEQVVFDYEVTGSAVTSISTGDILNGNEDGWYTIIFYHIGNYAGAHYGLLRFNGDTGSNYGRRGISAANTTVANWSSSGEAQLYASSVSGTAYRSFCVAKVYAKSGAVRLVEYMFTEDMTGTTVGSLYTTSGVWSNTTDNIISISVTASQTNGLGVGSRLIVLKANNFTDGTPTGVINTPHIKGAWVRVGSSVLGSAASSVDFTGLKGDTAIMYYLSAAAKSTGSNCYILARFNSDTGTNYGRQVGQGVNTTVAAVRDANGALFMTNAGSSAGEYLGVSAIIFSKSGFLRPLLYTGYDGISGTTVGSLEFNGCCWSNTSDEITSINISSNANQFDAGSQFELYALYKD